MAICRNGGTKVPLSLRVPIYRDEAISCALLSLRGAPMNRDDEAISGARESPRTPHLSLRVPIYRDEAISVGQGDCREHS